MPSDMKPGDVIRELARAYFKAVREDDWNEPLTSRALKLADAVDKLARLLPFLKCPRDTNNDGDCGQPVCPFCGHWSVQTIKAEIEEVCRE